MGWKITSIIIKDAGNISDEEIMNSLFNATFLPLDVLTFDECIYPEEEDTIYFGNFKDNLIISTYASDLVGRFFTSEISKAEKIFIDLFPNSEIGAFSLHSSVNYYAWTIISKGQKLRAKQGDGENGICCDFGEPLLEEQEFLNLSFKDKKGNLFYNWPKHSEVYTEDQIGENYVSKIWSRFTGTELFEDDELSNTYFRGYKIVAQDTAADQADSDKKTLWQRLFGKK